MDKYTEQAENFLKKHGIRFTTKFIKHDLHFVDDKKNRDIFKITLSRIKGINGGDKDGKFSLRFGQSINDSDGYGGIAPTAYDVLACSTKNVLGSFANFCEDFGKTEKLYRAIKKEWEEVNAFFTPAEIEELQDIN